MSSVERLRELVSELRREDPSILEEALEELGPRKYIVKYLIEVLG